MTRSGSRLEAGVQGTDVSPTPPRSREQNILPTKEYHCTPFYKRYHKEAEEYDIREFVKRYDEDLNVTLVLVGFVRCSGVRANSVTGWTVLRTGVLICYLSKV